MAAAPLLANGKETEMVDASDFNHTSFDAASAPKRESFAITRIHEILHLDDPVRLEHGLTDEQVLSSRAKHGVNKLPEDKPRPFIVFLLLEFAQPLILILCFLLALTIYKLSEFIKKGKTPDADVIVKLIIITTVICLVTGFNAVGNSATGKALGELASLAGAKTARCRRNGSETDVPAEDLVVGDVVLVKMGETVQADIRVMESVDLATVEAALTGEPNECKKTIRSVDPHAPFLSSMMYSGTSVVCGSGYGVVTAVGCSTEIGQIALKLDKVEALETPIQKTMKLLGAVLIILVLIMLVFFAIIIAKTEQYDPAKYNNNSTLAVLFEALSLAQILLPTTLMLTVTVNLRKGVLMLKQHNAVLRRFTAVETLGCTTIICSDKTGTLTEGKMTVVRCLTVTSTPSDAPEAAGFRFYPTRGFDPSGGLFPADKLDEGRKSFIRASIHGALEAIEGAGRRLSSSRAAPNLGDKAVAQETNPLPRALVGAAFLNCSLDTQLHFEDGNWSCIGNMSEAALVVAAAKVGMWQVDTAGLGAPPEDVHKSHPALTKLEVPFTSARKMKLTFHEAKNGTFVGLRLPPGYTHVGILKGAPDRVQPCGRHILRSNLQDTAPIDEKVRLCLHDANLSLANDGLRVLATAIKYLTDDDVATLRDTDDADARLEWFKGQGPTLLGLMGLEDPPRDGVKEAVTACHQAGIKVVMITGDQAPTASSIAKKIGIVRPGEDATELSHECSVLHTDPTDPAASAHKELLEIDKYTKDTVVWARAQPVDKIVIVESLQRQGAVAAMTGDGVNDAAALKAADIGTAMGIAGTEVAKASADMILLDDNFATIVSAVREGRHIYGNLQKYIYFYLGVKICELVLFTTCIFFMLPKPIGAIRALLAKNITHDTTPITLAAEEAEPYQMKVAPRPRSEFVMTPQLFLIRLVPQLAWFSLILLGGGSLMTHAWFNTATPKSSTVWAADWSRGTLGNCLKVHNCTDKGTYIACNTATDVVCRTKKDGEWFFEFGTQRLDEDKLVAGKWNDWTGKFSDDAGKWYQPDNERRTWYHNPSEVTFGIVDKMHAAEIPLAIQPCKHSIAKKPKDNSPFVKDWADLYNTDAKDKRAGVCWSQAAHAHFRKHYGDTADKVYPFPKLDPTQTRSEWLLRKLQGTQFLSFVMLELTIQVACRTEDLFFNAPYNPWFFKVAGIGFAFALCLIFIPGLNRGCEMAPVDLWGWSVALGGAVLALLLSESLKLIYRVDLTRRQAIAKAGNQYMNPVRRRAFESA